MNKIKIDTVGVAQDKSFPQRDDPSQMVQCYEIPCTGSVDGAPSSFSVKVYGKGSDQKVKQGLEFNGQRSDYQGTVFYSLKKADNPTLFASSSYGDGSGKGGFKPQHELNALRVAADVVMQFYATRNDDAESSPTVLADEIIKIANEKFVPFLRATSDRHDVVAPVNEAKKLQAATIRQLINSNDLTVNVQAAQATNSQLAAMYEAAGSDAAKFIQDVRAKFHAPHAAEPVDASDEEFEDNIPF